MYQALYRKYRPDIFNKVYGQEHITSVLKYEIANDRISHAYLFCGSRGTGKTTCAKILAKAVNCLKHEDGNPCGLCENCLSIENGVTSDIVEMDAASNNGVEYIRDIKEDVIYTPSMLKKKVYIIDEVHMLSSSAFNALLKTLEEPPPHIIFILATTELHKLPATVISRCQRFDFRRISIKNLSNCILNIAEKENFKITVEAAQLISKMAQGAMRDAIGLMELCCGGNFQKIIDTPEVIELLGISGYDTVGSVAEAIADKNYSMIFAKIAEVVASSHDILVFWNDLILFYRDMLVVKSVSNFDQYLELTQNQREIVINTARKFKIPSIVYHSHMLDEALYSMQKSPQTKRLCAEMTLIKMCDEKLSSSNEALVSRISEIEDKIALYSDFDKLTSQKKSLSSTEMFETVDIGQKKSDIDIEETDNISVNIESKVISKIRKIACWSEVIEKIGHSDAGLRAFLSDTSAYMDDSCVVLTIKAASNFAVVMIDKDSSKSIIRDALKICGCALQSNTEIKVQVADILSNDTPSAADELFSEINN